MSKNYLLYSLNSFIELNSFLYPNLSWNSGLLVVNTTTKINYSVQECKYISVTKL